MDSQSLPPLQRLFLWTLRHWGASAGPAPYVLRTLRASRAGPTLLGAADRLLSWHGHRGRGPKHLAEPAARTLTHFESQLLAAPYCAQHYPEETLRLWLADHFDARGLAEASRILQPLAEALEALGPDALLTPGRVAAAAYGPCPSRFSSAASPRTR